jgi:hypothetical protein
MHLDAARSLNTKTYGIAPDIQDDDADVVTNDDAFPGAACQNQHNGLPPWTPQGYGCRKASDPAINLRPTAGREEMLAESEH